MKTQRSRETFQPERRYSGVYQQQGRMLTDADWNELTDISKHLQASALTKVVGPSGAPRVQGVFSADVPFQLQSGHVFAGGLEGYIELSPDTRVEPGESYEFEFRLWPPKELGNYELPLFMAHELEAFGEVRRLNIRHGEPEPDEPDGGEPGLTAVQPGDFLVARSGGRLPGEFRGPDLGITTLDDVVARRGVPLPPSGAPARLTPGPGGPRLPGALEARSDAPSSDFDASFVNAEVLASEGELAGANLGPHERKTIRLVVKNTGKQAWDSSVALMIDPGSKWIEGGGGPSVVPLGELLPPQPNFPVAPPTPDNCKLYVDVWDRTVTWLEDPSLRDVALHGADTCTRTQRMAQVKWCPLSQDPELLPTRGDARVSLAFPIKKLAPADPCSASERRGPTGNALFRLEVHAASETSVVLKWSFENGAEQHPLPVDDGQGKVELPPGFVRKSFVYELFDEVSERHLGLHLMDPWQPRVGTLVEPKQGQAGWTTLWEGGPDPAEGWQFVRRWDGFCQLQGDADFTQVTLGASKSSGVDVSLVDAASVDVGVTATSKPSLLLKFENPTFVLTLDWPSSNLARFVVGDYWLVLVRPQDVERPVALLPEGGPKERPPLGVEHRYLELGTVDTGVLVPFDADDRLRRKLSFPSLTELTADRVGNDAILLGRKDLDGVSGPSPTDVQETLEDLYATKVDRGGDTMTGDLRVPNLYVEDDIVVGIDRDGDVFIRNADNKEVIVASAGDASLSLKTPSEDDALKLSTSAEEAHVSVGGSGAAGHVSVWGPHTKHPQVALLAGTPRIKVRDNGESTRFEVGPDGSVTLMTPLPSATKAVELTSEVARVATRDDGGKTRVVVHRNGSVILQDTDEEPLVQLSTVDKTGDIQVKAKDGSLRCRLQGRGARVSAGGPGADGHVAVLDRNAKTRVELLGSDGTVVAYRVRLKAGGAKQGRVLTCVDNLGNAEWRESIIPTGSVMPFAGTAAPLGWTICDGSQHHSSEPEFAALYAVIGTKFGSGNGSPGSFNIPDLRHRFVRGSGPGRAVGQKENDQVQYHEHSFVPTPNTTGGSPPQPTNYYHGGITEYWGAPATFGVNWGKAKQWVDNLSYNHNHTFTASGSVGTQTTGRRGNETRPKNLALLHIIKL